MFDFVIFYEYVFVFVLNKWISLFFVVVWGEKNIRYKNKIIFDLFLNINKFGLK